MLTIILRILGALGILLLCLAGLLLAAVLLVLFLPVAYRFEGTREESALEIRFKIRWLFGLLRIDYQYPKPGSLRARLLWFTVYDSSVQPSDSQQLEKPKAKRKKWGRSGEKETQEDQETEQSKKTKHEKETEQSKEAKYEKGIEQNGISQQRKKIAQGDEARQLKDEDWDYERLIEPAQCGSGENGPDNSEKQAGHEENTMAEGPVERLLRRIMAKYEKIKYTIGKICDRIKNISEHQAYYKELLLHEETKLLFGHGLLRMKRMLRSVRPRKLSADIVFGAGSPDVTGYALGVYCMFYPVFGQNINITPDFDNAVLKGRVFAAGHVMAAVLIYHVLRLLADKRLRVFIRKMKREET